MKKIKVKQIIFEWTEASHIVKDNTVVNTFKEAEEIIFKIAAHSHNEGYTKTAFIIEWEDGRIHKGRIDVQRKDAWKENPLGKHVKYLAGVRKPCGWTDEQLKAYLKAVYDIDEQGQEEIKEILNTYALEDIPDTPEQQTICKVGEE